MPTDTLIAYFSMEIALDPAMAKMAVAKLPFWHNWHLPRCEFSIRASTTVCAASISKPASDLGTASAIYRWRKYGKPL
jgi:hypothetical protein